jgi:hypothetical protein
VTPDTNPEPETEMSDAKAFEFAARHPEYIVIIRRESTEGPHWWHLRTDGTRCCEGSASGGLTRRRHLEIVDGIGSRYRGDASHAVYIDGGRKIRAAI